MKCSRCEHENDAIAKFCERCAAPLNRTCAKCGAGNPTVNKFCGQCGAPLTDVPQTQQSARSESQPQREHDEAERRQITVMFCDLVGSTELSARLDPEELRDAVRAYQAVSTDVIQRYGGHVAQYLGDGLLVYFGYPSAHEDDAERAVRAGLGIVSAIRRLNDTQPVNVAVRVGIHTGLVVVGEIGSGDRRELLALGETPNVAARLQALAGPGAVVISTVTHRLLRRAMACQDLGARAIKGIPAAMPVYRVLGEMDFVAEGRLTTALGPFVGRDQQLAVLMKRWEDVIQGRGHVVLIAGEPGIGKSRLLASVSERLVGVPHRTLDGRCSPYHQASPMYAVTELLSRALHFRPEDSAEARLCRLEEFVTALRLPVADVLPLLVSLLALPAERYPLPPWTPQRLKQNTIATVLSVIQTMAAQQPILLVVEDLHWIDPSTLELLSGLVEQVPTTAVCALFTARPEFQPPWAARPHTSQMTLERLPRRYAESMVLGVAGGKDLPPEVLDEIIVRTDGVPLFVEELTKMVLESQLLRARDDRYELMGPLRPVAIPTTLQDSLMARLDRLGTVKMVAQVGAVLGREFSHTMLQAVAETESSALEHGLARLVETELLYRRGGPPDATYVFKHALIQEAAYESLLKTTRQLYHRRAAQALEERFPDIVTGRPEVVAHHHAAAGLPAEAIPYWQRAGESAVRRSANAEAIAHFTRGLDQVRALPNTRDRIQKELRLLIALGPVLLGTRGFAAPETVRAYARAQELCDQLGDTPDVFPALWGQWAFCQVQAKLRRACEIGEDLLRVAESTQDPALVLQAHHALWPSRLFLGEFVRARADVDAGLAIYDSERHRSLAFLYGGHDAAVCGYGLGALALWVLGYPEQALGSVAQGLALAERLNHPHSTSMALLFASLVYRFCLQQARARAFADSCIALSSEYGFPQWRAAARVVRGSTLPPSAHHDEAIAEMRQGIADWHATGATLYGPIFHTLLAEACWRRGRIEESRRELAEATAVLKKTDERLYEAELLRLRGELALVGPSSEQRAAEAAFLESIEVARTQEARSWGLRATTSLARLWQAQGKRAEAHRLLGDAYAWFSEGFEMPDVRDARRALNDLA